MGLVQLSFSQCLIWIYVFGRKALYPFTGHKQGVTKVRWDSGHLETQCAYLCPKLQSQDIRRECFLWLLIFYYILDFFKWIKDEN